MSNTGHPRVDSVYRYPVKGLSPERLDKADLQIGQVVRNDRAYAIENGPGRFDPAEPRHLPKINFLMLMRDERLAALKTHFDDDTHVLTILRDGKQVARGDLQTPIGRQMIEQFMAAFMAASLRGAPKVVSAPGHSFSDVAAKCLHIVNLATVRDVERVVGKPVNALRFRANVYLDGLEPWQEFKWLDQDLQIGSARLQVYKRTQRCAATNVDPETAARDMAIPETLLRNWSHSDLGVYAKVIGAGTIAAGDAVSVE